MTVTNPPWESAAQLLMRMEWLIKNLPELPYPYLFAVLKRNDFTQLTNLADNRQALYAAIQKMIAEDELPIEIDEAFLETLQLLEQTNAERGDKQSMDNRVMLGMRIYFDELLTKGYALDRDKMVLSKGRKQLHLRHGILVED